MTKKGTGGYGTITLLADTAILLFGTTIFLIAVTIQLVLATKKMVVPTKIAVSYLTNEIFVPTNCVFFSALKVVTRINDFNTKS